MDEQITTFVAFTGASTEQAQRYLQLADGNVEAAAGLFFENPDLGNASAAPAPSAPSASNREPPITIDSDDDLDLDADDVQETGSRPAQRGGPSVEDDEAMARRLQQEMYGGGGSGGAGGAGLDEDEVRAPMARTTETLVGPGSYDFRSDPGEMNAAIAQQMFNRQNRQNIARGGGQAGIFNQRSSAAIWNGDDPGDAEAHRQTLHRATNGASSASSKANHLAELFRPPFDLIAGFSFSDARDEGKENEKWIMVNVQDPSIFDCQVLNRDLWKDDRIRETIKEHFLFLQYNKDDPRGQEYVQYYFANMRDSDDAYPHIAIIDPRTGEQVKTWSGSPSPKPSDFLMDLHEFLDRYSLKMEKKNPVQKQRKESKKDVAAMSEEEMLEMAMQASMANGPSAAPKEDDPDALTKSVEFSGKGKAPAGTEDAMDVEPSAAVNPEKKDTPFSRISSTNAHEEPASDPVTTTRIQFRHPGGRIVRRFNVTDPVRRLYEWLKVSPFEGHEGEDFQLIAMGKNLIESLDATIADANLKQGTVMVEFIDDE
ncbi:UBX domain-containing protein 5 [Fulvia fulva]|uniref:UBX domain-containing protein 5 n=1 Tax=Passalora fulva TaxID=5499 RepID=A0A9Q8LGP3_PASFU|nr:UBX domain-containing protein 5 [Fulvia fulva]UJO16839.1 UBX domain-containing protein 5 [Fulvia fulva]WPV19035.1 UBX domain-containing protein 5 [Fulvia fulva]